jgi:hypothetical protein
MIPPVPCFLRYSSVAWAHSAFMVRGLTAKKRKKRKRQARKDRGGQRSKIRTPDLSSSPPSSNTEHARSKYSTNDPTSTDGTDGVAARNGAVDRVHGLSVTQNQGRLLEGDQNLLLTSGGHFYSV